MRKISRLSLVAAVAVAGFTAANAQPLEQAIKNVEVSGSVAYRYDNFDNSEEAVTRDAYGSRTNHDSSEHNKYKIALNISSKVNDYVKFNSRFVAGGTGLGYYNNDAKHDRDRSKDKGEDDLDISLSQAYFSLTAIPNTTINLGRQGLATPYTVAVDANGNEQYGNGILALTSFYGVTLGAGYFNSTNINESAEINGAIGRSVTLGDSISPVDYKLGGFQGLRGVLNGTEDLYVATVQGDLDFIKLEAWYAGMQDTFNSYTLAITSDIKFNDSAKIGIEARYVNLDLQKDAAKDLGFEDYSSGAVVRTDMEEENRMFRLAVNGKFSIVNARLAWTKTGSKGGLTALDQDAKNTSLGWAISSNGVADADFFQAALGLDILDNLNFTLHYGYLKSDHNNRRASLVNNIEAEEIFGQLTYKMSKNLTTVLRYGNYKAEYDKKLDGVDKKYFDQDRGRIQINYTF